MSAHLLEGIFSQLRPQLDPVIEVIRTQWQLVADEWRRQIRGALVSPDELERLTRVMPDNFEREPGEISYEGLQQHFGGIGEQLAEQGISLSATLMSGYLLAETSVRYLNQGGAAPESPTSAALRLYGLVIPAVVAGYTRVWVSERDALMRRLERAGRRHHQASAYVTNIYEQERRRLSHDLHDEIGHQLLLLKLHLELMTSDEKKGEIPQIAKRLEEALALVSSAIESVRRLILDLGPAIFDELGFLPAIRFYARQFSSRTAISVTVRAAEVPEDLPVSHQVALYRVLQGALSNVVEHARAGRVKVTLEAAGGKKVAMVVEDNGVGFDPALLSGHSFGLTAMRERVDVLGGSLHIESTTAGSHFHKTGTRVCVELPLPEGAAG